MIIAGEVKAGASPVDDPPASTRETTPAPSGSLALEPDEPAQATSGLLDFADWLGLAPFVGPDGEATDESVGEAEGETVAEAEDETVTDSAHDPTRESPLTIVEPGQTTNGDEPVVEDAHEPGDQRQLATLVITLDNGMPGYRVQRGDTLSEIAWRLGVTLDSLVELNGIEDPDRLALGALLEIPRSSEPVGSGGPPERLLANEERMALVPAFQLWARTYEVPVDLLMALAYVESGWQAGVVSFAGAIGVGQLIPDTVVFVSEQLIGQPLDPTVPEENIRMSARFLAYLLSATETEADALSSYYEGLGTILNSGPTEAGVAYADAVVAWRPHFSEFVASSAP